jgi:energy-coupling factor transport system substrate-specific component
MYVTIFYGVVDKKTGHLQYARAGHDRPILLRQGSSHELVGEGIALGILEPDQFTIKEYEYQLNPGDRLILYTDGLTDVFTPDDQLFGREQFIRLLSACADVESSKFCQKIFEALMDFQAGADQFDDMTMLVMELTQAV